MKNHRILSSEEIQRALIELPDWSAQNDRLHATFSFPDFNKTMQFIVAVGNLAEESQNHPTFCCSYTNLTIELCTHDANNTITETDVSMAHKLLDLAETFHGKHK